MAEMEDGGWRMEDGGWRMEDGGWRMAQRGHPRAGGDPGKRNEEYEMMNEEWLPPTARNRIIN
jgi:hypothetical protein